MNLEHFSENIAELLLASGESTSGFDLFSPKQLSKFFGCLFRRYPCVLQVITETARRSNIDATERTIFRLVLICSLLLCVSRMMCFNVAWKNEIK